MPLAGLALKPVFGPKAFHSDVLNHFAFFSIQWRWSFFATRGATLINRVFWDWIYDPQFAHPVSERGLSLGTGVGGVKTLLERSREFNDDREEQRTQILCWTIRNDNPNWRNLTVNWFLTIRCVKSSQRYFWKQHKKFFDSSVKFYSTKWVCFGPTPSVVQSVFPLLSIPLHHKPYVDQIVDFRIRSFAASRYFYGWHIWTRGILHRLTSFFFFLFQTIHPNRTMSFSILVVCIHVHNHTVHFSDFRLGFRRQTFRDAALKTEYIYYEYSYIHIYKRCIYPYEACIINVSNIQI